MLNMNEANQMTNPDASAIVPTKRKRGRPRKYPRPDGDHSGKAPIFKDQNLYRGENAHVRPRFGGADGNQPRQADPVDDAYDVMVGQVVHGVIEAAFDAGYLLTVRLGNSETTLRGVVFKPGHYVPVSADNDVAPGVQMIRRNEIPAPRENHNQSHGHNSQSRDRNGTIHGTRDTNLVSSNAKQVPVMMTPTAAGIFRGNVVPVVLQPVNASNGLPGVSELSSAANQATHLISSKGKQALDAAHPSNGKIATDIQFQDDQQMKSEIGVTNQTPAVTLLDAEAQSGKLPGMPFEKLLTEVIKRIQVPSQLTQNNGSSGGKLPLNSVVPVEEDDDSDSDEALSVEPLQAVQPVDNDPAVSSRPLHDYRTGKMTELLLVLQENMMGTTPTGELAQGSGQQEEQRSTETELEDEDSDHGN